MKLRVFFPAAAARLPVRLHFDEAVNEDDPTMTTKRPTPHPAFKLLTRLAEGYRLPGGSRDRLQKKDLAGAQFVSKTRNAPPPAAGIVRFRRNNRPRSGGNQAHGWGLLILVPFIFRVRGRP